MKYVPKNNVIDAFIWTGDSQQKEDPEWIVEMLKSGEAWFMNKKTEDCQLAFRGHTGNRLANKGDYIIRDAEGEVWAAKPTVFNEIYIKADKIVSQIKKIDKLEDNLANLEFQLEGRDMEIEELEEKVKKLEEDLHDIKCDKDFEVEELKEKIDELEEKMEEKDNRIDELKIGFEAMDDNY